MIYSSNSAACGERTARNRRSRSLSSACRGPGSPTRPPQGSIGAGELVSGTCPAWVADFFPFEAVGSFFDRDGRMPFVVACPDFAGTAGSPTTNVSGAAEESGYPSCPGFATPCTGREPTNCSAVVSCVGGWERGTRLSGFGFGPLRAPHLSRLMSQRTGREMKN